eukprot:jgi/Galph1/4929/GphlegSOOS_G3561.1
MSEQKDKDFVAENVLKILVATDIHLGYCEKHPVRGDDSFNTFEEILHVAKREEADMVVLGGDLFHENKPSRSCLIRTMRILRDHCFGEKPVYVKFLSNPTESFDSPYSVNYLDPCHNVSLPVFTIHGNHDDPIGSTGDQFSALDILQVANMLNYFGKVSMRVRYLSHNPTGLQAKDAQSIKLKPLLFQKGLTKLALYGLGNIRDERLYVTWHDEGNVTWMRPQVSDLDDWFHMFVFHQNRGQKGRINMAFEELFPSFLDLVIWGHEHECKIDLDRSNPYISQPGSTVATSLVEGEAIPKHIGLLEIFKGQFKWTPIRLKTVRPFIMKHICLDDEPSLQVATKDQLESFLIETVEKLRAQAEAEFYAVLHDVDDLQIDPRLKQPLIRLRVEYSGNHHTINPQRFGHGFVGKIANSSEILAFQRKPVRNSKLKYPKDSEEIKGIVRKDNDSEEITVLNLIQQSLDRQTSLHILPVTDLNVALEQFVFKSETSAIPDFVERYLIDVKKTILSRKHDERELNDSEISSLCEELLQRKLSTSEGTTLVNSNSENVSEKATTGKQLSKNTDALDTKSNASLAALLFSDSEEDETLDQNKRQSEQVSISRRGKKESIENRSSSMQRKRAPNKTLSRSSSKKRGASKTGWKTTVEGSFSSVSLQNTEKNDHIMPPKRQRKSSRLSSSAIGTERSSIYDFDTEDSAE